MLLRRGLTTVFVFALVSISLLAANVRPGLAAELWPASADLLIGEVVTGGVSASDEYVEIYNAAASAEDPGGLELVYVTASGATVTRRAVLPAATMATGAHLLVANSAGAYAALGDATYSGGLAADGGVVVLRTSSGVVLDSVAWGTAAGPYVEGAVAPAPPAASSLERLPGEGGGNWQDTNDNLADFLLQPSPSPQNLASAATPRLPVETGSGSAEASGEPGETPASTSDPERSPGPVASSTPPVASSTPPVASSTPPVASSTPPVASSTPPVASSTPPVASSTPPVASSTPPVASSTPPIPPATDDLSDPGDVISIVDARTRPIGSTVHVAGVVTAGLGVVGADDLIAIGDSSGGIFVRVPLPLDGAEIGVSVGVIGTLAAPYGQLEVRGLEWLQVGEPGPDPAPAGATLPVIGEGLEGSLVTATGTIDSVTVDGGRLYVTVGDGATTLRVMADPGAGIGKSDIVLGSAVSVAGIVGQRATATGRLDGYRLWLRRPADLSAMPELPPPAPSEATPPAAQPTSTPAYYDLSTGLAKLGRIVDFAAVVTAPAGVIDWGGPTVVVDAGAAVVAVVVPAGSSSPRLGQRVHVRGKVSSLHSGRRIMATLVEVLGDGATPSPTLVTGELGAAQEWRLVHVCGRVSRLTRAGTRWRVDLTVGSGQVAVLGEPGAGISPSGLAEGRLALFTGIVRRSTSDSAAFVLLPRSASDMTLGPLPATSGATTGATRAAAGQLPASDGGAAGTPGGLVAISDLPAHDGQTVTIAGLVVAVDRGSAGPYGVTAALGEPAPGLEAAPALGSAVATLDDGTGSVRLGGTAAQEALALLEIGDAVEVSGDVIGGASGWSIEVDPERILALAGAGTEPAVADDPASADAAVVSADAGSPHPGSGSPDVAQARTIARPAGAPDELPAAPPLAALAMVLIATASFAALALLGWRRLSLPHTQTDRFSSVTGRVLSDVRRELARRGRVIR